MLFFNNLKWSIGVKIVLLFIISVVLLTNNSAVHFSINEAIAMSSIFFIPALLITIIIQKRKSH